MAAKKTFTTHKNKGISLVDVPLQDFYSILQFLDLLLSSWLLCNTPGPQPRTDAAMWLKRYSGLLRLHAALLSPAEGFLFPVFLSSSPSPQLLSSAALCLRAAPTPRTPFTFYTTGTATRCTVQATPLYSLIPVPQFTLS